MTRDGLLVAVIAYGRPELLSVCLKSLGSELDVLVVDNSRSDAVQAVSQSHGARYDRPGRNLGFAAGVNRALRHASGRHVLLLNPDAQLEGEGVRRLLSALEPGVAAVAPQLRRPSGEVEPTSWPMPTPWQPWLGILGLADRARGPRFLSGAVLLLSGEAVADVGPFDERFFLYAEESDWQKRAFARGWQVREVADVSATHVGGATSSDPATRARLFHESAEAFTRKWYGTRGWRVFRLGAALASGRRWLLSRDAEARADARLTFRLYARPRASFGPSGR